jgi:hypothetical protein
VEQVSRCVVRNVENFVEDGAGVTNPVIFFLVIRGLSEGNPRPSDSHKGERSEQAKRANFDVYCFHDRAILLFLLYFLNVVIRNGPLNSARQVPQQSEHKKNQKKKKDNLGNASGSYSNSAESQQGGKQSNDKESESPAH